jgi:hypothetical protein
LGKSTIPKPQNVNSMHMCNVRTKKELPSCCRLERKVCLNPKNLCSRWKMLGPRHSWGGQKVPRLAPKPDPLIYDHLPLTCLLDSLLTKPHELPVTQLARHVNLFHLVIADNRRPETLSLPHGLFPPIKPTTHFSQVTAL